MMRRSRKRGPVRAQLAGKLRSSCDDRCGTRARPFRSPPSTFADALLTVNYTELVPLLIKTAQEQNARISELETRVRAPVRLSSLYDIGGGAALGLLPLGFVLASRRRKDQAAKSPDRRT